jgi:hypothetical protein
LVRPNYNNNAILRADSKIVIQMAVPLVVALVVEEDLMEV